MCCTLFINTIFQLLIQLYKLSPLLGFTDWIRQSGFYISIRSPQQASTSLYGELSSGLPHIVIIVHAEKAVAASATWATVRSRRVVVSSSYAATCPGEEDSVNATVYYCTISYHWRLVQYIYIIPLGARYLEILDYLYPEIIIITIDRFSLPV